MTLPWPRTRDERSCTFLPLSPSTDEECATQCAPSSPTTSPRLDCAGEGTEPARKRRRVASLRGSISDEFVCGGNQDDDSDVDEVDEGDETLSLADAAATPRPTWRGRRDWPLGIIEGRGTRHYNLSGPTLGAEDRAAAEAIVGDVRLGISRSPVLDAFIYCALKGWGVTLTRNEGDDIQLHVTDFKEYYRCSAIICSKLHPTDDQEARIKALRRWFPNFPGMLDAPIVGNLPFDVCVQRPVVMDNKPRKLRVIVCRMQTLVSEEDTGRSALKRARED